MSQLPSDRMPTSPCRIVPRYRVVLHGFPGKGLMFVIRTVMELTRLGRAEATHKMWEAHHLNRSVLMTTYLERAEFFAEQFQQRELSISLERV